MLKNLKVLSGLLFLLIFTASNSWGQSQCPTKLAELTKTTQRISTIGRQLRNLDQLVRRAEDSLDDLASGAAGAAPRAHRVSSNFLEIPQIEQFHISNKQHRSFRDLEASLMGPAFEDYTDPKAAELLRQQIDKLRGAWPDLLMKASVIDEVSKVHYLPLPAAIIELARNDVRSKENYKTTPTERAALDFMNDHVHPLANKLPPELKAMLWDAFLKRTSSYFVTGDQIKELVERFKEIEGSAAEKLASVEMSLTTQAVRDSLRKEYSSIKSFIDSKTGDLTLYEDGKEGLFYFPRMLLYIFYGGHSGILNPPQKVSDVFDVQSGSLSEAVKEFLDKHQNPAQGIVNIEVKFTYKKPLVLSQHDSSTKLNEAAALAAQLHAIRVEKRAQEQEARQLISRVRKLGESLGLIDHGLDLGSTIAEQCGSICQIMSRSMQK